MRRAAPAQARPVSFQDRIHQLGANDRPVFRVDRRQRAGIGVLVDLDHRTALGLDELGGLVGLLRHGLPPAGRHRQRGLADRLLVWAGATRRSCACWRARRRRCRRSGQADMLGDFVELAGEQRHQRAPPPRPRRAGTEPGRPRRCRPRPASRTASCRCRHRSRLGWMRILLPAMSFGSRMSRLECVTGRQPQWPQHRPVHALGRKLAEQLLANRAVEHLFGLGAGLEDIGQVEDRNAAGRSSP